MKRTEYLYKKDLEEQYRYMKMVAELKERPATFKIITLGCQMNVRDSQHIAGMLEIMGMNEAPDKESADLVLYNTCCVRENAENKALGNVIWLKELKKDKPGMMICVGGCMTQEPEIAEQIKKLYPFVDIVFGTHNMHMLPEYIYKALTSGESVIERYDIDGYVVEDLPEKSGSRYQAFVNIMYGCDNFCSYCIVPYVRGRERSRRKEDILDEIKRLKDSGCMEITLLGQNVNSYMGGGNEFAELLREVDAVGIPRIRFMTSHPKDISDELIAAYGELEHLMPALHLPVQSGSNEILRRMNRKYTREHYIETVEKLRKVCPDIGLTSDIIVGFPGETEAQFLETVSLVKEVRYDAAFTFIYSPRRGTAAAKMPDDTPDSVKTERIQYLIGEILKIGAEKLNQQIGKMEEILVESRSTRDSSWLAGKTRRGFMVNFPSDEELIGKLVNVEIISAGKNTLRGRLV